MVYPPVQLAMNRSSISEQQDDGLEVRVFYAATDRLPVVGEAIFPKLEA